MKRLLAMGAVTLVLGACSTGGGSGIGGGMGGGVGGGTACGAAAKPGEPGDGALRGCSGCAVQAPVCQAPSEYTVSVSCHPGPDGGEYAVNGVAGSWCYATPSGCGSTPTCACLLQFGVFRHDGGGLSCPGNYWNCFDGTAGGPSNLHCNPP